MAARREHDSLGEIDVPEEALWGAQTERARRNFPITGLTIARHPTLLAALALTKQAAAASNASLGLLSPARAETIAAAAQEVASGRHAAHFPVDVVQGGAGTSTNMNINEVLANRGLELMGRARGDYAHLHPNDHVNLGQSTNDAYPTAVRVALLLACRPLETALAGLAEAFEAQGRAHATVVKLGRTQLQDAVPMTLGQELGAYAVTIREDLSRLAEAKPLLREINLGGTAIGTRLNAEPGYQEAAIGQLSALCGEPLAASANLVEASWDMGGFVMFSGVLKRIAAKLSKIGNDLRLLSSGPRGGLGEIALPPMQPGSSIMPGKVNPVIPEMLSQVCFQVIGRDVTVTMAAEGGQLQLNAFEPVIAHALLESLSDLSRAVDVLTVRCVTGIAAREENCARHLEASVGVATALVPLIGYERAASLAKQALATGRTVRALAREATDLDEAEIDRVLSPERLAGLVAAP